MRPVIDPETGHIMCWCGLVHPNTVAAEHCGHNPIPYTPGEESDMGPHRRPSYVPENSRYVPGGVVYRPRPRGRWWRFWLSMLLAVGLLVALVLGGLAYAGRHPGGPGTIPTTYAPPAAGGGPVRQA